MPRSVWLLRDEDRAGSQNDGTIVLHAPCEAPARACPERPELASFEELFRLHYPAIRELLEAHREPGLALVVASVCGLEALAWVGAENDAASPIIVGRHNAAEVFLPSDPSLSLRQLAVILDRRRDAPLRFRVLDLRTPTGFRDERGRSLEGVEADGPVLLRCASFALMLFPTGDAEPWPEDEVAAWRRVPERAWLDASTPDSDGWGRPAALPVQEAAWPPGAAASTSTTSAISFPGPLFPVACSVGSGPARGELILTGDRERASLRVGKEAARQGVLLGRYDRCDGAGLPLLANPGLSRVHLLVIEVGGAMYAIDTASHNGTLLGDQPIRCVRLEPGRHVTLPVNVAVEWQPFH
jgi:hypothetical protein